MSSRRKSTTNIPSSVSSSSTGSSLHNSISNLSSAPKDATRRKIEQMEAQREQRRRDIQQRKEARKQEEQRNLAAGNPGDVDFIGLVRSWRQAHKNDAESHFQKHPSGRRMSTRNSSSICICVRKRPLSEKERAKLDHDSVTCLQPHVWIHSAKYKVDGITKYLTHTSFKLDHAFDENTSTQDIYLYTTLPLVDFVTEGTGGRATVFCYGQTGSGKTYTMNGLQHILCSDLYAQLRGSTTLNLDDTIITVAFFELYGGFIQDLLNDRKRCKLLEDAKGEVNITGLSEHEAMDPEAFLTLIDQGNNLRTTHTTEANDTSSRSHAICQIFLRDRHSGKRGKLGKLRGKLSLVDLAGSERGTDTKSHNAQRRTESAEINTSLLSLKECIRALGQRKSTPSSSSSATNSGGVHVPYRGSKLTLILKDCFTSPQARTTMIATVSPGASATDHSLNTLRYADRIKEQKTNHSQSKSGQKTKRAVKGTAPLADTAELVDNTRLDRIMMAIPWSGSSKASATETKSTEANDSALAPQYYTVGPTGLVGRTTAIGPTGLVERSGQSTSIDRSSANKAGRSRVPEEGTNELNDPPYSDHSDPQEDDDDDLFGTENSDSDVDLLHDDAPTLDEESELRQTVQVLFELEETLLNQHMSNIQENAEMLTQEGKLLQLVQNRITSPNAVNPNDAHLVDEEMDNYAVTLAEFLDRKQLLISKLQSKLDDFKQQLAKEQDLAQRVTTLSQY